MRSDLQHQHSPGASGFRCWAIRFLRNEGDTSRISRILTNLGVRHLNDSDDRKVTASGLREDSSAAIGTMEERFAKNWRDIHEL